MSTVSGIYNSIDDVGSVKVSRVECYIGYIYLLHKKGVGRGED